MIDAYWYDNRLYIGDNDTNNIVIRCSIFQAIDIAIENEAYFQFDLDNDDIDKLFSDLLRTTLGKCFKIWKHLKLTRFLDK